MASNKGEGDSTMSERIMPIWEYLVEKLQYVDALVEQLALTDTLSKNQVEVIQFEKTPREKRGKLLDIIRKKCAYDIFSHCLRVSGQNELYKLMVDEVRVQPVTDELTTLQYRIFCQHGIGNPRKLQVPPHLSDRLEKQREALQEMTNVERLVGLMEEEKCLTREVTIAIRDQSGDKKKTNMLIDNVKKSTMYSFFLLTRFLDISQQKPLMLKITEEDTNTALGRMDDLLLDVYYNLLGGIALSYSELEKRLDITAREFVKLTINSDSKAVDKRGLNEAHADHSSGKPIQLTELFSDQENQIPTKLVLMIGAPGTGKSTASIQLAREAATKKALNVPHPPFVILLRSIEWKNHTSLKKLLLNRGPKLEDKERDQVWKGLLKNADDVTVILDGADEVPDGFFKNQPDQVAGEESKALPQDILNNLISGELLKGARVLVSSRPFGLVECWDRFQRKVDLVGFDEDSLKSFLNKELPLQHRKVVLEFLDKQINIRSLLLTPLHAASFVKRAESIQNTSDLLIQSRTELSLSLIDSLVKTKLLKVHKVMRQKDLNKQGNIVWKLCKFIAKLLLNEGAIKIEMTEEDLEEAEVTDEECVETGLFVKRDIVEDDVSDSIFEVPHQSLLEAMAAIGLTESQIKKLVENNDGRHDLIITYFTGIISEERNRKMLSYIHSKEDRKKDFTKLIQDVVSGVLRSKRRALPGGEEFCMRIVHESQQWSFISDLKRVMGMRWLTSDSSEPLMAADQLIGHDPGKETNDPLVRVEVGGIRNAKYCPRATALMQHEEVTAADIGANAQHLHNIVSVIFSSKAGITRETVGGVAAQLSQLDKLEAVSMEHNTEVWSSSDESSALGCLSLIPSLHYLSLSRCGLTSADVSAITSSCDCLLHLDIKGNLGVRGGDVESRQLTGLRLAECGLNGEELVELVARNGQTLEFLDATHAGYFTELSTSHINVIITCCPRLMEMYVSRGGELVRALSERRAVCLKHLWLYRCNFSSSSSSSDQVNPSELSDVLTRHSSISSLTMYECNHFTSEFMRLLSSSMASVTSLLISSVYHPRSSDVASLIRASPSLTQLWLEEMLGEWFASDFISVINAVNASPTLRVVGLDVRKLSVDEVRVVVRKLTRRLTRLWLEVDYFAMEEMAVIVMEEKEMGVVQLVRGPVQFISCADPGLLYYTYQRESGSFYQHLPPSLADHFRPYF